MKKLITLLLALAMCLSLCACGGGNDTPTTGQNEQLENNTPSAQETPTETTVPETTAEPEPVYETVEITMDNWQDYLEIKILPENREWEVNAFDEAEMCRDYLYLTIKDEHLDKIDTESIDLAIAYTYVTDTFINYSIDYENRTLEYGEIGIPEELKDNHNLESPRSRDNTVKMSETYLEIYELGYYLDFPEHEGAMLGDMRYVLYPTVTITRIQGAISILTN